MPRLPPFELNEPYSCSEDVIIDASTENFVLQAQAEEHVNSNDWLEQDSCTEDLITENEIKLHPS